MLYEVYCDKFATKENGVFVPRGRIKLKEGLNTILGDKHAENSIGKSTFLLIIDFCFGGDDYVDPDINNAKNYVPDQTICFAFKFGDSIEYFSRSIITPYEVHRCNENYEVISEPITISDFRDYLKSAHNICADMSFRDMVGRYMRIYGRENYNERFPLKYGDENAAAGIIALEKLFGVYAAIESYKRAYDKKKETQEIRKKSAEYGHIVTPARTNSEVKDNEREIERLEAELEKLTARQDVDLSEKSTERVDEAAKIKAQISALKRKRSRLVAQRNSVQNNIEGGAIPSNEDISELAVFFPNVNLAHLREIEHFHARIQHILSDEMADEISRLDILIEEVTKEVRKLEEEQRKLGIPVNVSKKYMEQYLALQERIKTLKAKNAGFTATKNDAAATKAAKSELEKARESQLAIIQQAINQEMVRLNDMIYDGERYAPDITFESTRTGNPKYKFKTEADGGTGTNYKGLIVFDLSVLTLTELPVVAHDSLIFKNIADLPIDRIMQVYNQSTKQVFIAFDKKDAFSKITRKIIDTSTVLELHENGGELFGWMWAKKKQIDAQSN